MCIRTRITKFGRSHAIYDAERHTLHAINCKSWACPECSKIKVRFLKEGLKKHFADNLGMRMLTLTLAPSIYSPLEHAELFQRAYKIFIKELRRSKSLTPNQNNFKYVRCIEQHKGERCKGHRSVANGYFHYHIMIDRYLPVQILQRILEHSVLLAGYQTDAVKFCNVNIKLIPSVKTAINYVISYIFKAVEDFGNLITKWTKSKGTPIFTKDKREGIYFLVKSKDIPKEFLLYLYEYSHESPENYNIIKGRGTNNE